MAKGPCKQYNSQVNNSDDGIDNDNVSFFSLTTYHVSGTVINILHVLTHKNPFD